MLNAELFESYYRTYNSENPEALRGFYHDDVELSSAQGVLKGADAILDTYRYLISVFHDQMTPEKITIDGDQAAIIITDRFTAKTDVNDFMGMKLKKGDSFTLNLRGTYIARDGRFKTIRIEQLPPAPDGSS